MRPSLCFDSDYQELVRLADGTPVHLRMLRPGDRDVFVQAFDRLSAESRYRRFAHRKRDLTGEELRFFTEVDGWNHFAIAAFDCSSHATKPAELLGVARLFRLPDDPAAAEMAFAVVDHAQQHGIGRLLVTRLVAAASERQIKKLIFYVLSENAPARKLLARFNPKLEGEGEFVTGELKVPAIAQHDCSDADHHYLRELDTFLDLFTTGSLASVSPLEFVFRGMDLWRASARELLEDQDNH